MRSSVVAGAVALTMAAQMALAQDVVGRSFVGDRAVELLSDKSWRFVDPNATIDSADIVYANTILIQPDVSYQMITYGIASEYTEQHQELNEEFLGLVKFE